MHQPQQEDESESQEAVENLLESYFMQIDSTYDRLEAVGEFIEDTEEYINIELDSSRNRLLRLEIVLTAATFAIAIFSLVAGACLLQNVGWHQHSKAQPLETHGIGLGTQGNYPCGCIQVCITQAAVHFCCVLLGQIEMHWDVIEPDTRREMLGGDVAGILGENLVLPKGITKTLAGFVWVNLGTLGICFLFFIGVIGYVRYRRLM